MIRRRRVGRHRGASLWREIGVVVLVAVLLSWLLKTFLVQAFYIPSESMQKTLIGCPTCRGDRIVVNKLTPGLRDLRRGDIVVFNDPKDWLVTNEDPGNLLTPVYDGLEFLGLVPASNSDLVKRVIGVSGDKVECCDSRDRLTVNGVPLNEPYLHPNSDMADDTFRAVVPPGRIWVMGDNRNNSEDSRAHQNEAPDYGMVPLEKVVGRAFAIVWPLDRARWLNRPEVFDSPALQPDVAG